VISVEWRDDEAGSYSSMRWSLLVLFALTACGASGNRGISSQRTIFGAAVEGIERPHPDVLRLPIIAQIKGGPTLLTIRGNVSPREADRIARTARATYRDVNRRFVPQKRPTKRAVDICVFESNSEYRRFVRQMFEADAPFALGFYMSSHRIVAADVSVGLGNLRHEMVHPLIKDAFPDLPDWLNEGLASLYGSARYRRGRYNFRVNYRLNHLIHARARGTAPGFVDLALSDYDTVHGGRERAFYAVGRYLLLYLEQRRRLVPFFRDMTSAKPTTSHQLNVLRRHARESSFWRWTRRIHSRWW